MATGLEGLVLTTCVFTSVKFCVGSVVVLIATFLAYSPE
jgi:hypothetical protein